jgi:hypothetical protein
MKSMMEALRARMEYLLARPQTEGRTLEAVMKREQTFGHSVPWALEGWRISSIPEWRAKLRQSIENEDRRGEMEARWMLEVLEDQDHLKAWD